jgi:ribosomal 50S subunit-recycling heat shock protein
MKRLILVVVAVLFCASVVFAAGPKTYQVTGPVLEIKDGMIIVEKGKDKWEIAKDAATKVTGDLKVGSKVTIEYTMKAATIEVKDAKKAEKKEKEEKKKDEKKKEEPKKK